MKDCNSCGKCCIKYSDGALSATAEEIALWEIFRPDIYTYVKGEDIWFDPDTGERLPRCPFLLGDPKQSNKYSCSIYHDRPEDCRHYPSLVSEMIADDCEMIELSDLNNPKQAQTRLDRLMQSSRPAKH